jgi:hypothetical protein
MATRMRHHTFVLGGVAIIAALMTTTESSAELPSSFDRKAFADALGAVDLSSCKKPNGPTGEGHVLVTVLPAGKIKQVVVDTPPFANTKAAKCIEKAYIKVRVPAFAGQPVVLGKKFKIE